MIEIHDFAPVVLFVFNRPQHTQRTIQSLLENDCSAETPLVIFSDAARNEKDVPMVEGVRDYIRSISGFMDVRIVEQAENMGLAESIISGVTEVINRYGRVIVLEDDMETSPFFLDYMNRALKKYRDNERVWCIHGYAFPAPMEVQGSATFFLKGAECWGWATWTRAWKGFCPDSRILLKALREQDLTHEFDYDGSFPYVRMLKRQSLGRIDSWAIRWRASAYVRDGLTLWPIKSLVRNIGLDGSGVHCDSTNYFDVNLASEPPILEDIPVEASWLAYKAYGQYLKRREGNLLQRAGRLIRRRIINVISDR